MIHFSLIKQEKKARCGIIQTAHGQIQTPVFMPVGTKGSVKSLTNDLIASTNAQIILGNTYHLMLKKTAEKIQQFGGLHEFINWQKPILTDSGGFQVMSLSSLNKVTENGVKFQSHIDGEIIDISPEKSMQIQQMLNSDIAMIFDQCISYPANYSKTRKAMELSLRWAERSKKAFISKAGHGLFGIVQGGMNRELRERSAQELINIGFDGYAIGGLAVGESQDKMFEVLDYASDLVPHDKPRYVMGIGKPSDILGAIFRGFDMFDCVLPTRNARNGTLYTRNGEIKITNAQYEFDTAPIDSKCQCYACKNHSRAYIFHLLRNKEILASTLCSVHNVYFYQDLTHSVRKAILEDRFSEFYQLSLQNNYLWVE